MRLSRRHLRQLAIGIITALAALLPLQLGMPQHAAAAQLGNRYIKPSDSRAAATGITYEVGFNLTTGVPLGSIEIEFCENDPLITEPCTPPAGMEVDIATLADETGETGFSIDPSSQDHRLLITRASTNVAISQSTYTFAGITNPTAATSVYYARLRTFASSDGSGPLADYGGISLYTTNALTFQTEVPPFLEFCVAATITGLDCTSTNGFTANFGSFSPTQTASAISQMVGATNAGFGYNITVTGTTMTSGNNVIPAMASTALAQTGVSQFGMNLRMNTQPNVGAEPVGGGVGVPALGYNVQNQYKFANGDVVATTPTVSDYVKYTVSYIVNVNSVQNPGLYSTTISYIALATF